MVKVIRTPIGQILVDQGFITKEQLGRALEVQDGTGEMLGKILVRMGLCSEKDVVKAFAVQKGFAFVDLAEQKAEEGALQCLDKDTAQKYKVLPFKVEGDKLCVAMENPLNVFIQDELSLIAKKAIEPYVATEGDIEKAINDYYKKGANLSDAIQNLVLEEEVGEVELQEEEEEELDLGEMRELGEDAPIIRMVNAMILQAVRDRATDIHVEPQYHELRVRFRIDGVLHEAMTPPKRLQAAIISRVKIMANLDIAEKRLPQDGRIMLNVDNKQYDLRVSTIPALHGEKVEMRILDKAGLFLTINKLGFSPSAQEDFEGLIGKPYGLLMATGPTGCGKTTTLYSALHLLNQIERNLITIEDPIEYQLDGVAQGQVNVKAGLTFANALRSMLRQDPDVVMVGEIRDHETAEIAIHAALTGHLVLSTMHTNDSALTVVRLFHMGVEPFLISSSLIGVVAQRLARTICPHCKEPFETSAETLRRLGLELTGETVTLYRGRGCERCRYSGYYGRIGIFEVMKVTDELRQMIIEKRPASLLRETARKGGMKSLIEDALEKVLEGVTTVEEAIRSVFVR